jgi:predicted MFS family arabinose efflux permease
LLVLAHSTCLVLLVVAVSAGWPAPAWILLAGLAGASLPMMGSMVRARWTDMIDDPARRSSAFALESSADEGALIVGPLLASALALAFDPAVAVLTAVGLLIVGGLALAVQRRTAPEPTPPRKREQGHPIRQAGMPVMVLMMAFVGGVFGSFQVSTVAFGEQTDPGWIGVLMAAFSVGSLVSGLLLATRKREWSLIRQLRVAVITLTVALVPLAFVGTPPLFAVVAVFAGLSVSVVMIGAFALVERLVPESRLTESLSSVTAAVSLGMSGGSWLGGVAIDASGPSWGLGLCAACAAAAAGVFWVRAPGLRKLERRADAKEPLAV